MEKQRQKETLTSHGLVFGLLLLILTGGLNAAAIDYPASTQTKLENGINITTSEIQNLIYSDRAEHLYIMRIPSLTIAAYTFDKTKTSKLAGRADITDLKLYPITKETAWVQNDTIETCVPQADICHQEEFCTPNPDICTEKQECITTGENETNCYPKWDCTPQPPTCANQTVCVPQPPICTNRTEKKNMRTAEYGAATNTISTTLNRNYMVRITTQPLQGGKWGGNVGIAGFDPDINACGALSSANTVYTMNESVNISGATCMNITAANITLDCAGFSISGSNITGTYGITNTAAAHNANITNCNISNFEYGIGWTINTQNLTITNNNVSTTSATGTGIFVQYTNMGTSGTAVIDNNRVLIPKSNSRYGIIAYNAVTNANITNNVILSNATSYYALDINQVSTGNYVFNNTISGVYGLDWWVVGGAHTGIGVINNTINTTTGFGMNIRTTKHTPVTGNVIRTTTGTGIYFLVSANNNTIANNSISTTTGTGISISTSQNNTIENNSITTASAAYPIALGTGTFAGGAHGTIIRNNNISENSANLQALILVSLGENITIENNWMNASGNGNGGAINAWGAAGNPPIKNVTIRNNTIFNMGNRDGIQMVLITGSLIEGNTITQLVNGVYVGCPIRLNQFTQNNTIANNTLWNRLSSTSAADICFGSTGGGFSNSNLFINNTLLASTAAHVLIQPNSSNNTFYWNNFTNTSGYYVNDTNGSNYYNTSVNGQQEGNIWFNVINRSVPINSTPSIASGWGMGAYVGNYPSSLLPYNDTYSLGKTANVSDGAPLVFVFSAGSLTIAYMGNMSADGTGIYRTLGDVWLVQTFNVSAVPSTAFTSSNCSLYYTNGSLIDMRTAILIATNMLNHTNIPMNITSANGNYSFLTVKVNCSAYGTSGLYSSTDTRTLNIVATPPAGGGASTGDLNMFGITMGLTAGWIFFGLLALYLIIPKDVIDENGKKKKENQPIYAFVALEAALFLWMGFLFVAIDDSVTTNPATANLLQVFIVPSTMILYASIMLFLVWAFVQALVKAANWAGFKVEDWWFDGRP